MGRKNIDFKIYIDLYKVDTSKEWKQCPKMINGELITDAWVEWAIVQFCGAQACSTNAQIGLLYNVVRVKHITVLEGSIK